MTLRELLNNTVKEIKDKEAGWDLEAICQEDIRNILKKKISEDTETMDYLKSFGYELGCIRCYIQTYQINFRNNLPYYNAHIYLPDVSFTRYKKEDKYFWKGYKVKYSEDLDKPLTQLIKENKRDTIDESYKKYMAINNTADSILGKLSREDRDKLLEVLEEVGGVRGSDFILNSLKKF